MIGIYIALGVVGVLAVMLLMVILRMFRDQRTRRAEEEKMRQEEKLVQDSIKEKLIKLETLAANPAQAKTLDEINKRLDSTTQLFGAIRKDLGDMQKAAKGMEDVAGSVSSFQELLISPKVRGNLGQAFMEDLIKDVLPKAHYQFQHSFRDGKVVDAVIKTKDRLIPIDSKFPLEEFQRMVNEGVDEETFSKRLKKVISPRVTEIKKYIRPNEGTTNFAMLYIPSEKIYSRLTGMNEFMEALRRVRIILVSPSTFYMYLRTILFALSGLEVEKKTQEILDRLDRLSHQFDSARVDWELVVKHITNALRKSEDVSKRLGRIDDNVKSLVIKKEEEQGEIPYE